MGGFYVPELEYLWGFEDEDRTLYDYAGEILKGKLGYSINTYQMRIYTEWGLSPDDIKFRHIAALSVELALRAGGIALFYILLILTGIVIYRRGIADFISLTAVVCLTYILLPQVFLIAHPKHTTFVLPVLLFIIYIAVMKKPKAS